MRQHSCHTDLEKILLVDHVEQIEHTGEENTDDRIQGRVKGDAVSEVRQLVEQQKHGPEHQKKETQRKQKFVSQTQVFEVLETGEACKAMFSKLMLRILETL